MPDYVTPPAHKDFKAIKICGFQEGVFKDAALAEIEPGGGGPSPSHTHPHDHLFIVLEGTATLEIEGKKIQINPNESYRIPGKLSHSVWNESSQKVRMLGITLSTGDE
jgi:mannose-6-phosphate isomerase-like protein (cupin superfamily)